MCTCALRHKLFDLFTGQLNFHFKVEMTINPAFEENKQDDGQHVYDRPSVAISGYSKVRPDFVIYLSCLIKSNVRFRCQI